MATGKSPDAGGISLRTGATARGCLEAIRVARTRLDLSADVGVAIQGFGSVGRRLAELLIEDGHAIVAVSDSGGGVADDNGLDLTVLADVKAETGSVVNAPGKELGSADVLAFPGAAIVVPSALQGVVDPDLADEIDARLVVEAANAPATVHGVRRLADRAITVVPDIAANAGGVVGSYHEWRDNLALAAEDPEADLVARVRQANERVWDRCEADGSDLRTAAAAVAIERVLDAA